MRALLSSALGWNSTADLGMAFSHAAGLCFRRALFERSAFPGTAELNRAAQRQMRSDTRFKRYPPESLQAHITKCSTLGL